MLEDDSMAARTSSKADCISLIMKLGGGISGDASRISSIPGWQTAVSRLECLELLSAGAIEPEAVKASLLLMQSLRELRYCHNCCSLDLQTYYRRPSSQLRF